jgi:hypothetical protein
MGKSKQQTINVQGVNIKMFATNEEEFISLTDIASNFGESRIVVQNWMRARGTIDFLGVWEQMHNPDFKGIEFDAFKMEAGSNTFSMSPEKWIKGVNAKGIVSKRGRYGGGTFGHKDIALEFCSWASPVFRLYVVKEFQRLKEEESNLKSLEWNVKRIMSKANHHIHTEAVRENLVPILDWNTKREAIYQASEADLLNLALFGVTAREWKQANPEKKGNIRDDAGPEQLLVLSNLQSLNARLLKWNIDKEQRIKILHETATEELNILLSTKTLSTLSTGGKNN